VAIEFIWQLNISRDILWSHRVLQDRLDRLGRRGMAAAMSTLTANPRVQLAAACVLGKLETQDAQAASMYH
jgi:hypothetical protein